TTPALRAIPSLKGGDSAIIRFSPLARPGPAERLLHRNREFLHKREGAGRWDYQVSPVQCEAARAEGAHDFSAFEPRRINVHIDSPLKLSQFVKVDAAIRCRFRI